MKAKIKEQVIKELNRFYTNLLESVYHEEDYNMIRDNKERFEKIIKTIQDNMFSIDQLTISETIK